MKTTTTASGFLIENYNINFIFNNKNTPSSITPIDSVANKYQMQFLSE